MSLFPFRSGQVRSEIQINESDMMHKDIAEPTAEVDSQSSTSSGSSEAASPLSTAVIPKIRELRF